MNEIRTTITYNLPILRKYMIFVRIYNLFGFLLDDSKNPKNAIGRIAKVKVPFKSFEQNIKVTYDKNGNIVHTSLQTELMIEHIWDFWREWKRGDDLLWWRP